MTEPSVTSVFRPPISSTRHTWIIGRLSNYLHVSGHLWLAANSVQQVRTSFRFSFSSVRQVNIGLGSTPVKPIRFEVRHVGVHDRTIVFG
uniref:Uncharacterized protein n=1 Tax=Helianthus annuus TaxID=4232 RepID=A0A251SHG8_HELAN